MKRTRAALAFGAIASGAFGYACVDFDALQKKPTSTDAAIVDAPISDGAETPDSGSPTDAAVDAPFCVNEGPHYLCADWDDAGTPNVGWDRSVVSGGNGGGAIARDLDVYRSPPASFTSSVANGSTIGGTYAALVKELKPYPKSSVRLAADVFTPAVQSGSYDGRAAILSFQDIQESDAGAIFYSTSLQLEPADAGMIMSMKYMTADGGFGAGGQAVPSLKADDWTRVVITLEIGPPQRVTVTFDGVAQVDQILVDSATPPSSTFTVLVGAIAVAGGALRVSYDNVTIDVD